MSKNNAMNPRKKGKFNNVSVQEESAVAIKEIATDSILDQPTDEEETYKANDTSELDDCVSFSENENLLPLYVDCLPDSGSTSHIFNQRDMFQKYWNTENITVGGVGSNKTRIQGKGTIKLMAK